MVTAEQFIPYIHETKSPEAMLQAAATHLKHINQRRSLREFSNQEVPLEVVEKIIQAAASAPSGAHKQPWHFAVVSSSEIKHKIRVAAEAEEYENYTSRMSEEWLKDLEIFKTNWEKPFLEIAPHLIVVFRKPYEVVNGIKQKNYYVNESCGIATGFLIQAIHAAGLVTLTHTPSPMDFLAKILGRPENEKPFLLLPIGYPAKGAMVPDIRRKPLEEVASFYS